LPFYAAEKNFLLNQKDFFSGTNAKCPVKPATLAKKNGISTGSKGHV
jgi:hypothetical protein